MGWVHVVFVFEPKVGITVYHDGDWRGEDYAENTRGETARGNGRTTIGHGTGNKKLKIDELGIWEKILNQAQAQRLFKWKLKRKLERKSMNQCRKNEKPFHIKTGHENYTLNPVYTISIEQDTI